MIRSIIVAASVATTTTRTWWAWLTGRSSSLCWAKPYEQEYYQDVNFESVGWRYIHFRLYYELPY